jgi:hypothetical protein
MSGTMLIGLKYIYWKSMPRSRIGKLAIVNAKYYTEEKPINLIGAGPELSLVAMLPTPHSLQQPGISQMSGYRTAS